MTDPGSSGGHSQSYSSSRKERGETKSCVMQSVCEAQGRLQLHTGGKRQTNTAPTPTQFLLFFFSPRREETWSRRRRKKGWMRKVFAARTLRLQKLLQVTLKKHTTDWIQPQKSWFRAEKFIFNAELRTTCPKILRTDTTNTWTVVHPDRSWTKDYKAKKLSGNLVNADFNIWAWRLLVICFVVISRCA